MPTIRKVSISMRTVLVKDHGCIPGQMRLPSGLQNPPGPRNPRTIQTQGSTDPPPCTPRALWGGMAMGQMRSTIADMDPVKRGRFENMLIAYMEQIV